MLHNVLDPEVAKDPDHLIVYGGTGRAARSWKALAAVAKEHFHGTLAGRLVLTAGLGEMGGAQPLAVTMNDGVALAVEIDKEAIEKRIRHGYLQSFTDDLDEALDIVRQAKRDRVPRSVALLGNAAEVHPELLRRHVIPDVVTDQTSAHDPLNGYFPEGLSKEGADSLRRSDPEDYLKKATRSILKHVRTMIAMSRRGAVAFEYGNNIRQRALDA